jgi:hypothetical protein
VKELFFMNPAVVVEEMSANYLVTKQLVVLVENSLLDAMSVNYIVFSFTR